MAKSEREQGKKKRGRPPSVSQDECVAGSQTHRLESRVYLSVFVHSRKREREESECT